MSVLLSPAIRTSPNFEATQLIFRQYQRALGRWPRDPLRPEHTFQDVLSKRLETKFAPGNPINEGEELKQVNALYSLVENRYQAKVGQLAETDDGTNKLLTDT
jgi:hypothetical protein